MNENTGMIVPNVKACWTPFSSQLFLVPVTLNSVETVFHGFPVWGHNWLKLSDGMNQWWFPHLKWWSIPTYADPRYHRSPMFGEDRISPKFSCEVISPFPSSWIPVEERLISSMTWWPGWGSSWVRSWDVSHDHHDHTGIQDLGMCIIYIYNVGSGWFWGIGWPFISIYIYIYIHIYT